jgi:hypothetical protein
MLILLETNCEPSKYLYNGMEGVRQVFWNLLDTEEYLAEGERIDSKLKTSRAVEPVWSPSHLNGLKELVTCCAIGLGLGPGGREYSDGTRETRFMRDREREDSHRIGILRSHFLVSRGSTEVHLRQDSANSSLSSVLADRAVSKQPEVTRGGRLDIASSRYTHLQAAASIPHGALSKVSAVVAAVHAKLTQNANLEVRSAAS